MNPGIALFGDQQDTNFDNLGTGIYTNQLAITLPKLNLIGS